MIAVGEGMAHLAFKIDGRRTGEVAFVVCLLQRGGRMSAHHGRSQSGELGAPERTCIASELRGRLEQVCNVMRIEERRRAKFVGPFALEKGRLGAP